MLFLAFAETVGPRPVVHNSTNVTYGVPPLQINCLLDSGERCLSEHFESFDFFKNGFYATGPAQTDYSGYGLLTLPTQINVVVLTTPHYDLLEIRENYTLNVTQAGISIRADNGFALARAFQTLAQLIWPFDASNPAAYQIREQSIADHPYFRYRGLTLDATQTYLPVSTLHAVIDGLSCAKMNALHLRVIGEHSSPVQFTTTPAESISKGAYDQHFVYRMETLRELQMYGISRGVFVMSEIANPNHMASLAKGYSGLIMNCSTLDANSINPVDNRTQEIMRAVITDLKNIAFANTGMRDLLHLGNDGFEQRCWEADPEIVRFMQEKKINVTDVYAQYVQNETQNVKKVYEGLEYPITFYYEEVLMAHAAIDKQSVIHFQSSASLNLALEKGFYAIRSTGWEFDKMWPIPTPTFYYGELWKDIFTIDILAGVNSSYADRVLGGAASMKGDAGSQNVFGHIFPKLFAVAEVLWSNEGNRGSSSVSDRLQSEICLMKRMGMASGPLWPSAPCWFE